MVWGACCKLQQAFLLIFLSISCLCAGCLFCFVFLKKRKNFKKEKNLRVLMFDFSFSLTQSIEKFVSCRGHYRGFEN